MKKGTCVCIVVLAAVGFFGIAFFVVYLETEVLRHDIYRAAVLEVVSYTNSSLSMRQLVIRNLETYFTAVKIAYINDVDIIVFPEYGIYGSINERSNLTYSLMENIPDPKESAYIPCTQKDKFVKSPILQYFSCLAIYGGMYIVANMIDYKPCNDSDLCTNTNCPDDGMYLFNTNVVFNKVGKLVSRYHKKHILFEDYINPSNCYGDGFFQTEFGNFFTTISTDLFFEDLNAYIKKLSPDSVVYPTYWNNPFRFISSPFQQSYAWKRNVNLLAANMYDLMTGELRSLIYSGRNGPLIISSGPYRYDTLLISNVPKNPVDFYETFDLRRKKFLLHNGNYYEIDLDESVKFKSDCDSKLLKKIDKRYKGSYCFPIDTTDLSSVKLQKLENNITSCINGLCCSIKYKAKTLTEDYFFLVSSYDATLFNNVTSEYKSCILSRCISEDGESCTYLSLISKSIFDEVKIKGNFRSKNVFPVVINSHLKKAKKKEWKFDGSSSVSYRRAQNKSLLTFGLFDRRHRRPKL